MLPQLPPEYRHFADYKKILCILALIIYSFDSLIPGLNSLSYWASVGLTVLVVIVILFCMIDNYGRDFPLFMRYFPNYCRYFFPRFGKFFVLYIIVGLALSFIIQDVSSNQQVLDDADPYVLCFLSLIYAPVIEESLYRGLLKKLFPFNQKYKWAYIFTSALIFGLIHVLYPGQDILQYLYLISYGLVGGFFALLYWETDNIFVSMMGHCCFNAIALAAMLLC